MRQKFSAKAAKKATIQARVYRAKEGKWYDLGVISKPKVKISLIDKLKSLWQKKKK